MTALPVSYTHLDVYKRQHNGGRQRRRGRRSSEGIRRWKAEARNAERDENQRDSASCVPPTKLACHRAQVSRSADYRFRELLHTPYLSLIHI